MILLIFLPLLVSFVKRSKGAMHCMSSHVADSLNIEQELQYM